MRLLRIEVDRFGRIDGRVLSGLSPQLTVVYGPNEAGKSSLTALVRHVLYGFPTAGDKNESPYLSAGGKRGARLVFSDESGEWSIERTEGVRGGEVVVRPLAGQPRDGLVGELTTGVSRNAYRVVLGFGLSDLAQLEELKGQDGDLLARLYAAGAGLGVSPIDIRTALDASREALWKKGGSAPVLNRLKAQRDGVRKRIRELEAQAEALRGDAERLEHAEIELAAARERWADAEARCERMSRGIVAAEQAREAAEQARARAEKLESDAAGARARLEAMPSDADALSVADAVDAVASELSGFRAQLDTVAAQRAQLRTLDVRMANALADVGWSAEQARAATADAGVGVELESLRERLGKARASVEYAQARAAAAPAPAPTTAARPWLAPGIAVAVIGALAVLGGLLASQWTVLAIGAVLAVTGAAFIFVGRVPERSGASGERAAASEVAAAAASLDQVLAEWGAWVTARGMGSPSDEPAAVAARLQAARAVREIDAQRAEAAALLAPADATAEAYRLRVEELCAPLAGETADAASLDRVAELVGRAARRTAAARQGAEERAEVARGVQQLERDGQTERRREQESLVRATEALAAAGLGADIEAARVALGDATRDKEDAVVERDRLADEVSTLRARVGEERRSDELASCRLDEESFSERIAAGMHDYAVLTMASHLLEAAQERYERDRQPEVVKNAEAAFARMTNGRYPRLTVPLGKDAIEVFDRAGAAVTPAKLSRGTAEQLYLALRIGVIDQLGQVGSSLPVLMDDVLVNFDADRIEPAARAIADLARRRQVIFFTCHSTVADLLCAVDNAAVRIDLERPL